MDLLGYAAFSGIERVAIIGGALVVGYWGYRLYGRDKAPGLIFMGIACAVLIAALATGGSHMRNVGASLQLAGAAPGSEAGVEPAAEDASMASEEVATLDPSEPSQDELSPFVDAQTGAAPSSAEPTPQTAEAAADLDAGAGQDDPSALIAAGPETVDLEQPEPSVAPSPAEASASEIALASSRELGGRIVSIRSENLTLEWSQETDDEADR